jgi:hypothetical protein
MDAGAANALALDANANAFSTFDIIASIVFSPEMKRHDLESGACEPGANTNILLMVQQGCGSILRR